MYPDFFKLCPEWTDFFYNHDMEQLLLSISETLKSSSFFPEEHSIFRCFEMSPFSNISVVYIGNEPSPNGSSTGLGCDVKRGQIFPTVIQRIYRELEDEGFYPTKDGNLEHWAKQGVLMLNISLTVRSNEPGSHADLWHEFFEKVLQKLSTKDNIIWVIEKDFKYKKHITNQSHLILERDHILGSNIFKKINNELFKRCIDKISW